MPICYIDAPPGISPQAKKRMMERIPAAIEEGSPDIRTCLRFSTVSSRRRRTERRPLVKE